MSTVKTEYLIKIAGILQKGLEPNETFEIVFGILEMAVPYSCATLYLYNHDNQKLEVACQKGDYIVDLAEEFLFEHGYGLSSWVIKQKKPIILSSLQKARPGKEHRFCSFISIPIWSKNSLIGVLNFGHEEPNVYLRSEVKDYELLSSQLSVVIEKILMSKKLQEQNKILQETLDKLKRTQKVLVEKERLAAIGEIAVTVNHEINNPLATIVSLAEILSLTLNTTSHEKIREGLEGIIKESKRISRIIQKLAKIKSTDLKEYVGQTKMMKLPE